MKRRKADLLVYWEPRWEAFFANLGPSFSRPPRLTIEHSEPRGKSLVLSVLLHAGLICATCFFWPLPELNMEVPRFIAPDYSRVIYYQAPQLPEVHDSGGAQEGRSGASGGRDFYHPTQTIRIARGPKPVERVVDAPKLNLPRTDEPVANLLALGGPLAPAAPANSITRKLDSAAFDMKPAVSAPPERPAMEFKALPKPRPQVAVQAPALGLRPDSAPRPNLHSQAPIPQAPNVARSVPVPKLALPVGDIVQPAPADIKRNLREFAGLPNSMTPAAPSEPPKTAATSASGIGGTSNKVETGGTPAGVPAGGSAGKGVAGATGVSPAPQAGEPGFGGPDGPSGIIVSVNPGDKIGMPAQSELGSLAMSPQGGKDGGFGGSGGGAGIGSGTGPGSGNAGTGPGAGRTGTGLGADPMAKGGTSLGPGPGGAGNGHTPSMPGVTIRGGAVNLPSFASGPGMNPTVPAPSGPRRTPAVIIVASPRAGGALNKYGLLKGAKVYTIYLDTRAGTAVLQYADGSGAAFAEELTAPELKHSEVPSGIAKVRFVVSCIIDSTGLLRNLKVLETSNAELTARMVSALANWRFRPVLRGNEAIEAQAILGLGVDTR
jgi:hypothetical protein